jgi:hypothetical protein
LSEPSTLSQVLTQITDGHPAVAAETARRSRPLTAAEEVVLGALLRHAKENALKARVDSDMCQT